MADQQYDLFFNGQLLEGHFEDFVKADIKALFKANDAYVDRLFSGEDVAVKKAVDKTTAIKFQQAFKKAGAKLIVKVHSPGAPATQPAKPAVSTETGPSFQTEEPIRSPKAETDQPKVAASSFATTEFELTQSSVAGENDSALIEHHQPDIQAPASLPTWDIAAAGEALVEAEEIESVSIDTSAFSLAETGSNLTEPNPFEEPAPVIDTSAITVAEVGTTLDTLKADHPPVSVDISHLSVES